MSDHPEQPNKNSTPPEAGDGTPKFGRLLIVLVIAVIAMGLLTWASEAYYS
jgi:hypothetical protein